MNEWRRFFNRQFAPLYEQEEFTKNTVQEIDFLVQEFGLPPGASILDVGCGTGRHSIGLARKGYRMTGVDISPDMLEIARENATSSGVEIDFVCSDAQSFTVDKSYDGAICLCEGAFGLLGAADDPYEHDVAILNNINRSLKKGAKFITTLLNATRIIRSSSDEDVETGRFQVVDLVTFTPVEIENGSGDREVIDLRERYYTAPELRRILVATGFQVEIICGGTAGAWHRRLPALDEFELMAICRKR